MVAAPFPEASINGEFNLIACAAAFHWMEPREALARVKELLCLHRTVGDVVAQLPKPRQGRRARGFDHPTSARSPSSTIRYSFSHDCSTKTITARR